MQTLRQTLLWLADEIGQLTRFNRSDRHWLMPLAASLASSRAQPPRRSTA